MSPISFSRRQPCPVCSHIPLLFVTCRSCRSIFAWCGEEDYAIGVYRGTDLHELGLGESRNWAREHCPACQGDQLEFSSLEEVKQLGFKSSELH